MQLRQGSLLQGGKYRIEKVLGQGGFGITYLAEQSMLERKVCIKEFFFKDYCERDESTSHVTLSTKSNKELVDRFRKKFLKEARVISKLHHDHIVQIHDIFEENSTAYYVMDYIEGESLGDMLKRVGFLPEQQALAYIKDVAGALAYIHSKSINHLDIKPGNIMLRREDHRLLLIDFGVSKQYDEATFEGTTTTPVGISHGYSPAEQYRRNGVQSFSPQSDVYSLAATLYKLLTGVTPPEAIEVQDEGLPLAPLTSKHVSNTTIEAIVKAMKPRSQRTQSVEAFIADLNEPVEATVVVESVLEKEPNPIVVKPETEPQQEKPHQRTNPLPDSSRLKRDIMIGVVAAIVIIGGFMGLGRSGDNPIDTPVTDTLVTETPTQPTTGTENGHAWVDLGLSVKWATKNVGASSPSDYGDYFAWGEIATKPSYDWSNCFDLIDIASNSWETYKLGGQTEITPTSGHDTARENWGGTWRVPTAVEGEELCKKCNWTWTNEGGHEGYTVTGPNGNSIFLPAAGFCSSTQTHFEGAHGYYSLSTLSSSNSILARNLCFDSDDHDTSYNGRGYGQSVRPVTD